MRAQNTARKSQVWALELGPHARWHSEVFGGEDRRELAVPTAPAHTFNASAELAELAIASASTATTRREPRVLLDMLRSVRQPFGPFHRHLVGCAPAFFTASQSHHCRNGASLQGSLAIMLMAT